MSTTPANAAAYPASNTSGQATVAMIARQAIVNAQQAVIGYELLVPLKPSFISPMLIQTAFNFSGAVQRWVCRLSGLRLLASRWFLVFLACSLCVASASSYLFASTAPPRWRCAFSQLAPVAKSKLSVFASGSNISVKPTCILRSAYLAR